MPFKRLKLFEEKTEELLEPIEKPKPLQPKITRPQIPQILRVTPEKEEKPAVIVQMGNPNGDPSGWKRILLEEDPVYIQSEDLQGNFVFPTGDTTEQDVSALSGGPDLTGAKRRRYGLYFDMTGVYQDTAAWTKLITRVKQKIDDVNYRSIDRKDYAKNDFSPSEEPAIPIDLPLLAKDTQVTMQFDVGLTGSPVSPRIYWGYVKEKLEA